MRRSVATTSSTSSTRVVGLSVGEVMHVITLKSNPQVCQRLRVLFFRTSNN